MQMKTKMTCFYTFFQNIEHDPLDDLAQYYADQLYTYFQDVKEVLEYLRDGESNEGVEQRMVRKKSSITKFALIIKFILP